MPVVGSRRISDSLWFQVLLGVVGLGLISASAVLDMHGLLERGGSWWRPLLSVPGHLLLLLAWWRLGPRVARPLLVLVVWVAAIVAVPPLHSRDAYSYAAQGWLMANRFDPYLVFSGSAEQSGLLVGVHWFRTTSVYPPLSLEIFGWVARLFDSDLYWTPIGMRVPNLLAIAVLVWVLPKLAAKVGVSRAAVLWAGLLNPVVIVQWVGGIHNDAVMVAVIALAFWVAYCTNWRGYFGMLAGGALIGVAMAVKQSAALAGLGVVAIAWANAAPQLGERHRTWAALIRRCLAAGALAVLVFVGISLGTGLGFGWRYGTAGSPLQASSNAPISWVASFLRYHELLSESRIISWLTMIATALVATSLVWLVWRYGPRPPQSVGNPWVVACGSLLSFAILGPALQPWYLTWVIPFVILATPGLRVQHIWLIGVISAALVPALQDVMAPYLAMGLLLLPLWGLWIWLGRHQVQVFPSIT